MKTNKLLQKAARQARDIVNAKKTKAQQDKLDAERADKYGIVGKPKGTPKNIHRGSFQTVYKDEDWATDHPRVSPPVLSLDSSFKLGDATRS